MRPIYTAFFTRGTLYEREADRLRRSLDRLGLEHDLRAIDSRGDWVKNSKWTAFHVCNVLADYPDRPVVQLDADAVVWKVPVLFDELPGAGVDIAVHYRKGRELLNGTVWLNATPGARLVAERYRELITNHPGCVNEQLMLSVAIDELRDLVNVRRLPPGYTYIFDLMKDDLAPAEEIVIEHLQASRHANCSPMLDNRLKRLAELQLLGIETP